VYEFLIFPTAEVIRWRKRDTYWPLSTLIDWKDHNWINPLNETNHLRVDRVGSEIRLYINGVNVDTYVDGELAGPGAMPASAPIAPIAPRTIPAEAALRPTSASRQRAVSKGIVKSVLASNAAARRSNDPCLCEWAVWPRSQGGEA